MGELGADDHPTGTRATANIRPPETGRNTQSSAVKGHSRTLAHPGVLTPSRTCSTPRSTGGPTCCRGTSCALDGAGSPRLALVREPDRRGRAQGPLPAFGGRSSNSPNHTYVAADDDRVPASLDDDDLHAGAWRRRDESSPGKLVLAVDRHVPHAGRLDPLANGVVVLLRASSSSRRCT